MYLTESGIVASAVGHASSDIKDYDEERDNYESFDLEEGGQGGLGSSSSVLMSSLGSDGVALQRSRGQQGYEFSRVEIRAYRKKCQGKWLQRSAAPIVDLFSLVAPLLLIASFTIGAGNVP